VGAGTRVIMYSLGLKRHEYSVRTNAPSAAPGASRWAPRPSCGMYCRRIGVKLQLLIAVNKLHCRPLVRPLIRIIASFAFNSVNGRAGAMRASGLSCGNFPAKWRKLF